MSYTQWVSNGTNVSYVPKEKDTGEVITPFTTTAPGGVPNSSYAPSTYVLAASGAWIPQTVGTSSSEVRRPTAYTLLTSNPSPYFEATDTSLVYDSDTNHLTTNGRFELQGLSAQNDASFKFSSFQTKAQTWTSATLNISRNYASTRWTSGTEARYYLSTDGGTNWTLLLTDDYDNDPVTVTIFSHTLATSNPSSLSNYQVKVEIDAFSSGALGSVGVLDLQLYDIWIEGIYTVSGGSGTVTSITTTGANGVTISGGSTQTITTSGTFALALGNITPTSISTGTGSFSGDVEFAASIKSPNGSNSPVTIVPDGTGDLHVNADSLRLGDNNADATIATNGTGDLILTTHEGSATQGIIRLYDGANGNITLTPNGTGQVQVGSDQVVTLTASQTLTNKTLSTGSTWNGNVIGSAYGGAGTVNGILKANGSGTVSAASAGTDYVTSVSVTSPVSNTGTSANPTIALGSGYGDTQNPYGSKTANYFLAAPNGTAGSPTFRAIVAADIPTLNQNTTGTAANVTGTVAVGNGGTGLTSLTAGYIPYGNGTSAFGSSANLFWDSANSRLGVGTTSPSEKINVSGGNILVSNSGSCATKYGNGSLTHEFGILSSSYGGYGVFTANSAYVYANSSNVQLGADGGYIAFGTGSGSLERMRIDSSGNVGIGKTPSAWGGSFATTQYKGGFIGSQASGYLYTGQNTYYNGTDWKYINTAAVTMMEQSFGAFVFLRAASGTAGNNVSFSESMRIDSSGNLGLGTSSPLGRLDVRSAVGSSPDSTIQNIVAIDTTSYGSGNGGGIGFGFVFNSGGSVIGRAAVIKGIKENATDGNYASALTFSTTQNSASTTERMRIDSNGNVGIGVTPSAWGASRKAIELGYAGSAFYIYPNTSTALGSNHYVNSSGNNIYSNTGYGAALYNMYSGEHQFYVAGSGTAGNTITFTQAMTLTSGGNLLIGNTNGTEKLTVTGNIRASGVYVGNGSTGDWNKGFGGIKLTTTTSTPTGGQSGDFVFIYT